MMALSLSGHIGMRVADLIDGRLSAEVEERAWQHVLACRGCRSLVEAEGWTKRQLGTLGRPNPYAGPVPMDLMGALRDLDDLDAWVEEHVPARPARIGRRTSLALVSAGSVGAAVFGLVALTAPPPVRGEVPGGPASIRMGVTQPAGTGVVWDRELRRTTK